jgi:6-pyruvoyltetrahydropterin/6-carboxytetrahydropterin synthase
MYTIGKTFTFCAGHHLLNLPDSHPCSRVHGHNYTVEVVFQSRELDDKGMVIDYREISEVVKEIIDKRYDHRDLNEVLSNTNADSRTIYQGKEISPTAENLAREIYVLVKIKLPGLVRVRVSETQTSWAEYSPT